MPMQMPPRLRWPKFRASEDSSASAATLAWPASPSATRHGSTIARLHLSGRRIANCTARAFPRLLRRRDTSAGVNVPLKPVVIEGSACFRTLVLLPRPVNTAADFIDCPALPCPALVFCIQRITTFGLSVSCQAILWKKFCQGSSRFRTASLPRKRRPMPANLSSASVLGTATPVSPPSPFHPSPCHPASMHAGSPLRLRSLWHADKTKFCTPMRRTSSAASEYCVYTACTLHFPFRSGQAHHTSWTYPKAWRCCFTTINRWWVLLCLAYGTVLLASLSVSYNVKIDRAARNRMHQSRTVRSRASVSSNYQAPITVRTTL